MPDPRDSSSIVFQPEAQRAWARGIDSLVSAIAPTLGPAPRLTAIDGGARGKSPELLDNGATIARRIIEISNREANSGLMFLRGVLWKMHQEVGDGTTTAALIFKTVYEGGIRYLSAGGNAMLLRASLEKTLAESLESLDACATPLHGREAVEQLARSVSNDEELIAAFGKVFEVIGAFGRLDIEAGRGRKIEHQFVDGAYWRGAPMLNQAFSGQSARRRFVEDGCIFISNMEFNQPLQLYPVLTCAKETGKKSLLIIAGEMSDTVKGFIRVNDKPAHFDILAVKAPGAGFDEQRLLLDDLAILTGGRQFLKETGEGVANITPADFGGARRLWLDAVQFGIARGEGDPYRIHARLDQLKKNYLETDSIAQQIALQERMGGIMSGSASIWVGGATESEINFRKEIAQQLAKTLRSGLLYGVQPGGGLAFHRLAAILRQKAAACDDEERMAHAILAAACEAPLRRILWNLGQEYAALGSDLDSQNYAYNLDKGVIELQEDTRVVDAHHVVREALRRAVTSAALALTTDVIIQPARPEKTLTPN